MTAFFENNLSSGIYDNSNIFTVVARVAESEVKCPTPTSSFQKFRTFPKFPTTTP